MLEGQIFGFEIPENLPLLQKEKGIIAYECEK
jgi:hypothetical protein